MNPCAEGKPLVSIITVVYNGERYIEQAILSVLNQTYAPIEYIVVDGASTDSTPDILKRYSKQISVIISEPDKGIYDAMNKGLALSKGQYIGFLNADDLLIPDAIEAVVGSFESDPKPDFVYGSVDLINEAGEGMGQTRPVDVSDLNRRFLYEMPFPHPSCIVSRKVFEIIGGFDLSYRLSADYDFVIRMVRHSFKGSQLHRSLACFRLGGRSGGVKTFLETRRLHKNHGVGFLKRNRVFLDAIIKRTLLDYFPGFMIRWLQRFRRESRHTVLSK